MMIKFLLSGQLLDDKQPTMEKILKDKNQQRGLKSESAWFR